MNRLSTERRVAVVSALVEGNSIRATCWMTGVATGTVLRLLADLGTACAVYHDENVHDLNVRRVQADEIWSFVHATQKNVPTDLKGVWGYGDVWTWTALCPDTKFMVSWLVASRDTVAARYFMGDVAARLAHRVQLTTDGHKPYLAAVEAAFGSEIDYSVLNKVYSQPVSDGPGTRYSPAICTGITETVIHGAPDAALASTSRVERSNLTMRMSMRRFTRLTNAFSKKVENLEHAVALHFTHYNYCRPHRSLKGMTPAQRVGLANHRWSLEELVGLLGSN